MVNNLSVKNATSYFVLSTMDRINLDIEIIQRTKEKL